jgi:hypothetical protein
MPIYHEHNLAEPLPKKCPFGIRVRLRSTDPFRNLIGDEWSKEHWFETRDAVRQVGQYCSIKVFSVSGHCARATRET